MSTQDPFATGETKKLPSMLNVLTILTFIGSGVTLVSGLWNFARGKKGIEELEKLQDSGQLDTAPDFVKKMAGPEALANARLMYENRIPLLIIMLVGVVLCVYGAMQMRKLQKTGFFTYLIGEVVPVFAPMIFVGAAYMGGMTWILVFPLVFIILYFTQLKYMK